MFIKLIKDIFFFLKALIRFIFGMPKIEEKWIFPISMTTPEQTKENIVPKIIWMYWDGNNGNALVDLCISNTKTVCNDFDVRVLNNQTILAYIELPVFNEELPIAVKADYIRLALLKKYGGIWMDASIFLTENLNWVLEKISNNSTFVFYSDHCTTDYTNPIVENWFIATTKDNEFINDWFAEFQKCIFDSNPTQYYKNYAQDRDVIQNIPNTDYLMCYIAAAIIRKRKNYNVVTLNSGSQGHYYNYALYSNGFFIALKLLLANKKYIYNPRLIKFTNETRGFANKFIENRFFRDKSILGSSVKSRNEISLGG